MYKRQTGGWAKATDNVTFPNSSIISTGATAPRNNVGQEGHLYWDTAASNLYVKSGGTWHIVSGASGGNTFAALSDTPATYTGEKGKITRVKNDETGLFFSDDIEEIETDVNKIKDEITTDVEVFKDQSVVHDNENFYRFSPIDPTLDSTKNYKMTVKLGTDSFGQQKFDAGPLLLKDPSTVGTVPSNDNSITLKFTDSINEFIEVKLGHDASGKLLVGGLDGTFIYTLSETELAWGTDANTAIDARVLAGARTNSTDYMPANRLGQEITQSAFNSLSPKVSGRLYFVE